RVLGDMQGPPPCWGPFPEEPAYREAEHAPPEVVEEHGDARHVVAALEDGLESSIEGADQAVPGELALGEHPNLLASVERPASGGDGGPHRPGAGERYGDQSRAHRQAAEDGPID